jgi:hypothetical protein
MSLTYSALKPTFLHQGPVTEFPNKTKSTNKRARAQKPGTLHVSATARHGEHGTTMFRNANIDILGSMRTGSQEKSGKN